MFLEPCHQRRSIYQLQFSIRNPKEELEKYILMEVYAYLYALVSYDYYIGMQGFVFLANHIISPTTFCFAE